MLMSQGLRAGGVTLEYGLIRVYIVAWMDRVHTADMEGKKHLGKLAKECEKFAQLACGGATVSPTVQVKDNDLIAFLETTIENLRAIVSYTKEYTDAIRESIGEDFSGESLADIFKRFSVTPDVEGASQWIREACNYILKELINRDEGAINYIRELIDSLVAFRANLIEMSDAMETGT